MQYTQPLSYIHISETEGRKVSQFSPARGQCENTNPAEGASLSDLNEEFCSQVYRGLDLVFHVFQKGRPLPEPA